MNKSQIIEQIANKTGETKATAEKVLNAFFDALVSEVKTGGGRVTLAGFGTFAKKQSEAYTARNPKTGDPVAVPAKTSIGYKVASTLVDEV